MEETGFNWGEYLEETGASAAPHTSFKHVSDGDVPSSGFLLGCWGCQMRFVKGNEKERDLAKIYPLEKGMATHSSILAWRIPWTEESMGSQRIGHT